MRTLGEKIRQLRKEKQMTLAQVADGQITKGMLSFIENGKAQPSMETLIHIANRLSVSVAELVGSGNQEEIRTVLEQTEVLWRELNPVSLREAKDICTLIEPLLNDITETYEGGRLCFLYSMSLLLLGKDNFDIYMKKAEEIYSAIHLHNELLQVRISRTMITFRKHDYRESLRQILQVREEAAEKGWHLTETNRIELNYYEAILYYATGQYENGTKKVEEALAFLQETGIYYLVDDLYRLIIIDSMFRKDEEQRTYYMKKMLQYADFTESDFSRWFVDIIQIHYLTFYKDEYDKAHDLLKTKKQAQYEFNLMEKEVADYFYLILEVAILYRKRHYQEALSLSLKMKQYDFFHHPYDLMILYQVYGYRALSLLEIGDHEAAVREINIAMELMDPMPDSPYKNFVKEAAEKIYEGK